MRILLVLLLSLPIVALQAQTVFNTPNTFRSASNPHYWKNKMPYASYWQQDVHYTIEARIDDSLDVIVGDRYELVYWNNSPDTLKVLYFNLFQNAFQPGSHYHALNEENDTHIKFGKNEKDTLCTVIDLLRVNGEVVDTVLDNTILQVKLNKPLPPHDSVVVSMKFRTYYGVGGSLRRRMKMYVTNGTKHYDGVFWYPSITVYDHKFGWNTDQHLDKEFYHDFGTFDIALTFPQEYIVEATGILINADSMYADSLRQKIDLKNFKKKPAGGVASIIIPRVPGKTKTWIWHAENVHNFAFTADPTYRIGETSWNGIRVIAIAQEQNAWGWQNSADFTARIIKIYSQDFGMYAWPKIIVADAKDGMEYPMLTLDNGTYPGHQDLLAHEVGHMWFYGMVGSNETYRAMLDEGFTQFLEVWSMDKIVGPVRYRYLYKKKVKKGDDPSKGPKAKKISRFFDPVDNRYDNLYFPYMHHVSESYDEPLNTHSSAFNSGIRHNGNYGLVYYKTGVMLCNLRYVLGDTLFQNAMKHYVQKWKFAHPYPEDFREAIIEYTHVDLNWFFDQWMETTKYIDYGISKVKKTGEENGEYQYDVTLRRYGRMHMPIEFTAVTKENQALRYYIPNTWFIKETEDSVLAKWFGWDLLHPTYTAHISLPGKLDYVNIDPSRTLADADLTDNKRGDGGINTWQLDTRIPNNLNWFKARNYWRPDLWYNAYDGVQIGLHVEGKYFRKYQYAASAWFNTGLGQWGVTDGKEKDYQPVAFTLYLRRNLSTIWKDLYTTADGFYNAGIWKAQWGIEKTFRRQDQRNPEYTKIGLMVKYLGNTYINYREYLLYPAEWGLEARQQYLNASLNLSVDRRYQYRLGWGLVSFTVRTPFVASDYNYSQLSMNSVNHGAVKKLEFHSRVFAQLGLGTTPYESSLYVSGANAEQLIENKYTRARAFVPEDWTAYGYNTGHFQYGGGLNLRGYTSRLLQENVRLAGADTTVMAYRGNSGASWNLELDFDRFIPFKPKLFKNLRMDTYLFSDMGVLSYVVQSTNLGGKATYLGKFRMDAGIGMALNVKFSYYSITPLVIRFDMPFYVSNPAVGEEALAWRWMLGINRTF